MENRDNKKKGAPNVKPVTPLRKKRESEEAYEAARRVSQERLGSEGRSAPTD